jgi:DNA-binding transcriptional regulator LsrR (DeoR family)
MLRVQSMRHWGSTMMLGAQDMRHACNSGRIWRLRGGMVSWSAMSEEQMLRRHETSVRARAHKTMQPDTRQTFL